MSISISENRDCMEAMRQMPDKMFELAIVDPPYGIGNFVRDHGDYRGSAVQWNESGPNAEYFQELKRVSKNQIIWGANYFNCFDAGKGAIVWYKHQRPEFNASECEIASCSMQKRTSFIDLFWTNILRGETTIHPCQKPIKLYETLLIHYAHPGDRILDTHLGSGSSRIAAYNLGFDFTGYEIDKDYFEAQEERFAAHTAQVSLFVGGTP